MSGLEGPWRLWGPPPYGTDGETEAREPGLMPQHSASGEHWVKQAVPISAKKHVVSPL